MNNHHIVAVEHEGTACTLPDSRSMWFLAMLNPASLAGTDLTALQSSLQQSFCSLATAMQKPTKPSVLHLGASALTLLQYGTIVPLHD